MSDWALILVTSDKGKPSESWGRKATGPRFLREAMDDSPKDPKTARLPDQIKIVTIYSGNLVDLVSRGGTNEEAEYKVHILHRFGFADADDRFATGECRVQLSDDQSAWRPVF
jgi:hypothetical protein